MPYMVASAIPLPAAAQMPDTVAVPPEKADAIAEDLRALRDQHPDQGIRAFGFDMTPLL
jgi:hypothetical protein